MAVMDTRTTDMAIDKYNDESLDVYMKTLLGEELWARHRPRKNVADLTGTANDNINHFRKPVQLDLFPETLTEGE